MQIYNNMQKNTYLYLYVNIQIYNNILKRIEDFRDSFIYYIFIIICLLCIIILYIKNYFYTYLYFYILLYLLLYYIIIMSKSFFHLFHYWRNSIYLFRDLTYVSIIPVVFITLQWFRQNLKEVIWNLHYTDEDQKSHITVSSLC